MAGNIKINSIIKWLKEQIMKGITFAVAFILTVCAVIAGVILYPNILGQAVTQNNEFVFALFLGPFCVFLALGWLGEKIVLRLWKPRK